MALRQGWKLILGRSFTTGQVMGALGAATMRLNQNILLLGKKVVLVPYTSLHVPRYHEWMKSEELQRLTASEPLTLEQEYAMQRSWREDADSEKWRPWAGLVAGGLTPEAVSRFPPVLIPSCSPSGATGAFWKVLHEKPQECTFIVMDAEKWQAQPGTTEESCMAGDVNLFLTDLGDPSLGEIEVMIAEPDCRGKGFGTEAVLMMMSYAGCCEQRLPGGDAQTDDE
ncbi:alpha/beta-tubulin-N-acetyltransferase 9 isoform X5 [Rhinolophus ferrumequinum]|uniref:alpha/beta-tubulin-N-acetyltransferase 9 isoform X5 n=1 Tax=Rhinolophus ferrumequinum TaxID=59479 RepID=UPI00140F4F06|nr:alpha/beta-tubulin-N-acetyltransferase 9 isoform X5 [Rhinolophus ferrumequinum]